MKTSHNAMEAGNHFKNGASLKSLTSKGVMAFAIIASVVFIACQKDGNKNVNDDGGTTANGGNEWVQIANYPGAAVANAVAFSINGKVYVGMGQNSTQKNDLWEYDPTTNKWTGKKDFPGTTNGVFFVINNEAYVIDQQSNNVWQYDPIADNWTQKATFQAATPSFGIGSGNKGYVGSYDNHIYEYNPETDTWQSCTVFTGGNLSGMTVTSTEQNLYFIGPQNSNNFWTYDTINDKWAQKADFPVVLTYGIAFCREGIIYAGMGAEFVPAEPYSHGSYYNDIDAIYKYDTDNNSWSISTYCPVSSLSSRVGKISVICNGKLYIGLGTGALDFWEYSFY